MSTPFTDYTKPTATASRVAQVQNYIQQLRVGGTEWETCFDMLGAECRTLAAEVDARDEVIGRLLAMLKPEPKINYECRFVDFCEHEDERKLMAPLYARACEIAGRTE